MHNRQLVLGAYEANHRILVSYPIPPPSPPLEEEAKLLASDGAADDWFGYSVALSGDYAPVSYTHLTLPTILLV